MFTRLTTPVYILLLDRTLPYWQAWLRNAALCALTRAHALPMPIGMRMWRWGLIVRILLWEPHATIKKEL